MKNEKSWRLLGILAVAFCTLLAGRSAFARLTGTNPTGASADAWCVGKTAKEVCVDASGNVIPTTTNVGALGTSSLKWTNAFLTGSVNAAQIGLTSLTTTQLSILAPATTGQIVVVSMLTNGLPGSVFGLCVATSAATGAWVYPSTTTAVGANPIVCK